MAAMMTLPTAGVSGRIAAPVPFRPSLASSPLVRPQQQTRRATAVRATALAERVKVREYPDPGFIAEVSERFPKEGVASVEEARVLLANGFAYLDVRPEPEAEAEGKVKGCVNVPFFNGKSRFDSARNQKVIIKEKNPNFVDQVKQKFKPTAKLLVGCGDGKTYSIDALIALDAAGFTNIVGLKGGFTAFNSVFDTQLRRRARPTAPAKPVKQGSGKFAGL